MTKASCATKLTNAEPAAQKAKADESKAAAKCQALIAIMSSQKEKLRKAKAKKKMADKKLKEARTVGPVKVAKKDASIAIELAKKAAKAEGLRVLSRKKAVEKAKKLHSKAKAARLKVMEIKSKILRKKAAESRAKIRAHKKAMSTPKGMQTYLQKLKAHEGKVKGHIHHLLALDVAKTAKTEKHEKELTSKQRTKNHEKTAKEARAKRAEKHHMLIDEKNAELKLAKERGAKSRARGSAMIAGLDGGRCVGLATGPGEACAKKRARNLLSRENAVKDKAYAKERKVKRKEVARKKAEHKVKRERKNKAAKRERARKEVKTKEKKRKSKEKDVKAKKKMEVKVKKMSEKQRKAHEKTQKKKEKDKKVRERASKKLLEKKS